MVSKPYSAGDLIDIAIRAKRVDPSRIIDTYANKENWTVVNARDKNGDMRAYWTWHGPVIVGYELAQWVERTGAAPPPPTPGQIDRAAWNMAVDTLIDSLGELARFSPLERMNTDAGVAALQASLAAHHALDALVEPFLSTEVEE